MGKKFNSTIVILFISISWILTGSLEGIIASVVYVITLGCMLVLWFIPIFVSFICLIKSRTIFNFIMEISHLSGINSINPLYSNHLIMFSIILFIIWCVFGIFINCGITLLLIERIQMKKNIKKHPPDKRLALTNCRIYDGRKDSEVIKDGLIIIDFSKRTPTTKDSGINGNPFGVISYVGGMDDKKIDKNDRKINLKGYFVIPGMINAHCHLTSSGRPIKAINLLTRDDIVPNLRKLLKNRVIKIFLFQSMKKSARTSLFSGMTTLRTMGDPSYIDVKLRDLIDSGAVIGPRLLVAGQNLSATGGHGALTGYVVDSIPEVRKAIRLNLRHRVDCIKIISTGGVMDSGAIGEAGRPQMSVEEIRCACEEAHKGNLLVATHCESTQGISDALAGGVDTIEHGAIIPGDLIPKFQQNGNSLRGFTAMVPTFSAPMGLSVLDTKITKISAIIRANSQLIHKEMVIGARIAYRNNIKIGVGTDASVPYSTHYNFWKELVYLTHYIPEVSNKMAIHLATLNNAEILGISNLTGSIEVGKSADLVALKKDPLQDLSALSKIEAVFIRGMMIKNPKVKKIKKIEKTPIDEIFPVDNN